MFVLGKRFGNENIVVRVSIDNQPDFDEEEGEEYEDEDEEGLPVEFQVNITKEDEEEVLVFECESDGEYLVINRVALDSLDDDEPGMSYKGPVFENLDDTLQQAFVDFLEERGINSYLGEYIRVYLADKATLEYQQWLGRMRSFIQR
ncbi:hypothetical protein GPECTOR_31g379 [Gonium pectorale]|uniref:Uncharacterized protein n=1 Tax=Gonium pectorale TaxID=33097 RepID=A0A150GEL7_GONPE|nr:hypothetical protein GPECTOR_31g379 [Gonium pectorale]|eukprot:KXZ48015.1 hypothetical protein GPECTOR_31g379 [Gonium pectorale]